MKNYTTLIATMLLLSYYIALPVSSMAQAGSLDLSFDTDGKVTTHIGNYTDEGRAMAIQSDGKILVAGTSNDAGRNYFALVRYNTNGSLDTTFDADGKVTTAVGSSHDYGYAVALQNDGKILVAGYSDSGFFNHDFALVRYNTNGSLDTTFDTDGKVTTAINGTFSEIGYSVAIQSDGKIIVAGASNNGSDDDFALVRYNNNGSLDTTFDTDGIVTTAIGAGFDSGSSVALQSDGKIVVAGYSSNPLYNDLALVRYNTNGSLDTSFDADGIVITSIGTFGAFATDLELQSNGKIIVAGYAYAGDYADLALVRYNTNGSMDTTFDTDGIVTKPIATSDDFGYALAIQADGKIVVAGASYDTLTYEADYILARYNTNGSIDSTFDTDGIVTTQIGVGDDEGYALAIQNDGKIVVAGTSYFGSYTYFSIVRYNNNNNVGINPIEVQDSEIKIYPNPFSSSTIIQSDKILNNATLTVYNIYGQQVKQLNNISGQTINFKSDNLSSGVYFIQVTQENKPDSNRGLTNKLIVTD